LFVDVFKRFVNKEGWKKLKYANDERHALMNATLKRVEFGVIQK